MFEANTHLFFLLGLVFYRSRDIVSYDTTKKQSIRHPCVKQGKQHVPAILLSYSKGNHYDSLRGSQPSGSQPSGLVLEDDKRLFALAVLIDQKRQMHRLASEYYKGRFFWFLFLPAIALTLAAGILSVFIKDDQSSVIATLSFVSVFWQSLTKQLNYATRSKLHETASVALDRISESIQFFIRSSNKHTETQITDFFFKSQEKFDQALSGVTSPIPIEIVDAYGLLQTKLSSEKKPDKEPSFKELNIGFQELFDTFCNDWFWPLLLPRGRTAVEKTRHPKISWFK